MELKDNTILIYIFLQSRLNCTFMELKEAVVKYLRAQQRA